MAVTQRSIDCNRQKIKAFISSTLLTGADADKIVTTVSMKVGAYSIAAQPSVPSKITVTATASGTADTMGIITIVGTNIFGSTITDVITPVAGSAVTGTKYFKTVTSVTGSGWVIDAGSGNDSIVVGVLASGGITAGGLPVSVFVITGNIWINPGAVAVADTTAIPLIAGDSIQNLVVSDTLSLISDGSGATFYALVMDEMLRP